MLHLEKLCTDDATDDYLRWVKDPETLKYLSVRRFETFETLEQYINSKNTQRDWVLFGVFDETKHVGNVALGFIDYDKHIAAVGILIDPLARGRGYCRDAIKLIIPVAKSMGLTMLYLTVDKRNTAAKTCFLSIGFKVRR